MSNTQQPEALRLAHALGGGKLIDDSTEWADTLHAAATKLHHQHTRIEELEAQLSAIGACGVEPLRKQAVPDERKSFDAANLRDYFGGPLSYRERDIAFMAWQARAELAATRPTQPAAQGMGAQDAARYQALVESGSFAPSPFDNGMWGLRVNSVPSTKAELDAAVDRVIAAQAKQGDV